MYREGYSYSPRARLLNNALQKVITNVSAGVALLTMLLSRPGRAVVFVLQVPFQISASMDIEICSAVGIRDLTRWCVHLLKEGTRVRNLCVKLPQRCIRYSSFSSPQPLLYQNVGKPSAWELSLSLSSMRISLALVLSFLSIFSCHFSLLFPLSTSLCYLQKSSSSPPTSTPSNKLSSSRCSNSRFYPATRT